MEDNTGKSGKYLDDFGLDHLWKKIKSIFSSKQDNISITTNTSTPTANDTVIMQANGSNDTKTFLRRKMSDIMSFFKNKFDTQYLRIGAFVQRNNTFGLESEKISIAKIDNSLYAADKRFIVTREIFNSDTGEKITDQSTSSLFDGGYEGAFKHPITGEYELITIKKDEDGSGSLWTYGGGYLYVSFYYTKIPDDNGVSIRWKYKNSTDWNSGTLTKIQTKSNQAVFYYELTGNQAFINTIEIKVQGKTNTEAAYPGVSVTEIEFIRNRATIEQESAVVKYGFAQEMFGNLTAPKFITKGGTATQIHNGDGSLSNNLSIARGGTSATTAIGAEYNILNQVADIDNVTLTDDRRLALKNTSKSATNGVFKWLKMSDIWNYIKGKVDAAYTGLNKTGTVTSVSVKMNGDTKGTVTTSGEIDLGTVLTSHQSLTSYLKVDGTNGTAAGVSALINKLTTETTKPTDDDYFIAQHSSGGTTTTTYHRKKASSIWSYISDKISSELGLTAYNYGGSAATADIANEAGHATTASRADCDGDGNSISGNYSKNTHTHDTTLAASAQTSSITLAPGGKYSLGTGGTDVVFTMPSDNYVWHQPSINGNTVGDRNFIQMTNDASMPTASKWWHIINCVWNGNDASWPSQFAIPTSAGDGHCYFRYSDGTTKFASGWKKLVNSSDFYIGTKGPYNPATGKWVNLLIINPANIVVGADISLKFRIESGVLGTAARRDSTFLDIQYRRNGESQYTVPFIGQESTSTTDIKLGYSINSTNGQVAIWGTCDTTYMYYDVYCVSDLKEKVKLTLGGTSTYTYAESSTVGIFYTFADYGTHISQYSTDANNCLPTPNTHSLNLNSGRTFNYSLPYNASNVPSTSNNWSLIVHATAMSATSWRWSQLAIPNGNTTGSIYYRTIYSENGGSTKTFGTWVRYTTTNDLGSYVAKAGDTMTGALIINTGASQAAYNQGLRVNSNSSNGWGLIMLGCPNNSTSGTADGGWIVGRRGSEATSGYGVVGDFVIQNNGSNGESGLTISKANHALFRTNSLQTTGSFRVGAQTVTGTSISGGCLQQYNATDKCLDFIFN